MLSFYITINLIVNSNEKDKKLISRLDKLFNNFLIIYSIVIFLIKFSVKEKKVNI